MRHRTKFREDWSNRSGDMADFRFFKMAAAAILKNRKSAIEQYLLMRRPVRVKSAIHRVGKSSIICYVSYFTYFT